MTAPRRPAPSALILAACGMAQICVTLDYMALSVALPRMSHDLHVPTTTLQWALSAYLLAFASGLIVGGRLGDLFGRKKALIAGLALFGGASILGGLAPGVGMVVLGRTLQGVGAALFFPATLSIPRNALPANGIAKGIGTLVAIASLGVAAGPFVGGALTDTIGWRWVFLINAPIALAAILLAVVVIPESRDEHAVRHIDLGGLVTIAGSVVLLTLAVDLGPQWSWGSLRTFGLIVGSIVLLAAFVFIERRVRAPLIDLHLFANRPFRVIGLVGSIANFMFAMAVLAFTFYFQELRGLSPLMSGLLILPFSLAGAAVGRVAGRLCNEFGPRLTMSAGLLCTAGSFAAFAAFGASTPWALAVVLMAFMGLGCSGAYSTTSVATVSVVESEKAGEASGVVYTGLVIFAAFAVAVTAELVEAFAGGVNADPAGGVNADPAGGVIPTIWIGAAIAGATAVLSAVLVPSRATYRQAAQAAGATEAAPAV